MIDFFAPPGFYDGLFRSAAKRLKRWWQSNRDEAAGMDTTFLTTLQGIVKEGLFHQHQSARQVFNITFSLLPRLIPHQ
jgi:hypothetical protein